MAERVDGLEERYKRKQRHCPWVSQTKTPLDAHGSFFLRQLLSPSCIQASSIFLVRSLPGHSLPPGFL